MTVLSGRSCNPVRLSVQSCICRGKGLTQRQKVLFGLPSSDTEATGTARVSDSSKQSPIGPLGPPLVNRQIYNHTEVIGGVVYSVNVSWIMIFQAALIKTPFVSDEKAFSLLDTYHIKNVGNDKCKEFCHHVQQLSANACLIVWLVAATQTTFDSKLRECGRGRSQDPWDSRI